MMSGQTMESKLECALCTRKLDKIEVGFPIVIDKAQFTICKECFKDEL